MSSSAKSSPVEPVDPVDPAPPAPDGLPYGWDAFAERPAPERMAPDPPSVEIARVLQIHQSALNAERGRARTAVDEALAASFRQAVLVTQLEDALERHRDALDAAGLGKVHRELRIRKDEMLDALRHGGVTAEDPVGRPLAEVADAVEVIGWTHEPRFDAEVVARTQEPIILYRGAVVRLGQVIMGAPPHDAAMSDGAEPDQAQEQARQEQQQEERQQEEQE
jgi:hypothetical protein